MEHKISAVSEKVDTWQSNYGEMKSYYVQFEGNAEAVKINQKPDTPAPTVGQILTGDIVADKFGKKFQKAAKPGFTVSGGSQSSEPPKQIDNDSMYRCNALNNAVAFVNVKSETDNVLNWADEFYQWLKNENQGYAAAKATAESLKPKVEEEPLPDFSGDNFDASEIPF